MPHYLNEMSITISKRRRGIYKKRLIEHRGRRIKNLRVVSDAKTPLNPRHSNLGSLFHCHPQIFPCDDTIPEGSTVPPQPIDLASGSSAGEDLASRS